MSNNTQGIKREKSLQGVKMSKRKTNTIESEKKKREPMTLRDIMNALLVSLAANFGLFIVSPSCVYLNNQQDFPITFRRLMIVMGIGGAANTVVFALFLLLLRLLRKRLYEGALRFTLGLMLSGFIQCVFLNADDTVFSGDRERFNHINAATVFNFVLYFAIALIPVGLHIFLLKWNLYPKLRKNGVAWGASLAFTVQFVWAAIFIYNAEPELASTYTGYLSYKPAMSLSEDENIVVFLSDRLDGEWMDDLIEQYPELTEKLDGFTFYQNNVAHNTNTFPSVPQMLTNTLYNGKEWPNYMREAWSGDTLPSVLKEKGNYDINLLPDCITTINNTRFIEDQCDNIAHAPEYAVKYNYFEQFGILHATLKLSAARVSPYYLKGKMAKGLGANVGRHFVQIDHALEDQRLTSMKPNTDLRFMNYLTKYGLNANNEHKTFSFIHLSGAHTLSNEIAELYAPIDGDADFYQTTRGDFEIIFEYMNQLKKLGLYDNTTIIILGDHGRPPVEINPFKHTLDSAITTALLIKPKNSSGELQYDRYSELSNDNFPASVLQYAGIEHGNFGLSYRDIIDNDLHPDRFLQTIKFNNYGRLSLHALYKITGDARDFNNWEVQPKHEHE